MNTKTSFFELLRKNDQKALKNWLVENGKAGKVTAGIMIVKDHSKDDKEELKS